MAGVFKTVTCMFLVLAAVVFAEDYDVGDDTEWARPSDPKFYDTWAAGKTFRVGDELEFDFTAGRHDVAVVTKDAYENCVKEKPLSIMMTPPVKIILNTTGPQYYICTFGDHCRFGQKLTINVVGAGGATTPGATTPGATTPGAGGTTPATPGAGTTTTTTPTAGSAASTLGGASFLVAFVSAVVALF